MNDRKRALLSQIIKEYIKSASPIGSKLLQGKSKLGVSSATIRNEMSELENEGYIAQPHTSAGRIPTEKGYKFFLENYIKEGKLSSREQRYLSDLLKEIESEKVEYQIKEMAKMLAEISQNAVVVGFSEDHLYYTGLSNLFSQPEFKDPDLVYEITHAIDHLEQVMLDFFDEIEETIVQIGSDNPFGGQCGAVLSPWQIKRKSGIIGIIGPIRMDYEKNLGLVRFFRENI